jgi:hypothetical protein
MCNQSVFSALKADKQFVQWNCSTVAQAHAQDLSEVLVEHC